MGESGRFDGGKVDGPNDEKWTVLSESGRFKTPKSGRSSKVDGPKSESGRFKKTKSGRSKKTKSGRSKRQKVDGPLD